MSNYGEFVGHLMQISRSQGVPLTGKLDNPEFLFYADHMDQSGDYITDDTVIGELARTTVRLEDMQLEAKISLVNESGGLLPFDDCGGQRMGWLELYAKSEQADKDGGHETCCIDIMLCSCGLAHPLAVEFDDSYIEGKGLLEQLGLLETLSHDINDSPEEHYAYWTYDGLNPEQMSNVASFLINSFSD